ncbi:MAG: hypothetical protein U5R48_14205 [Gammaproteobacteria bacterium]|nr:hypothetical protein [Gammaproteobacteria bacterium]
MRIDNRLHAEPGKLLYRDSGGRTAARRFLRQLLGADRGAVTVGFVLLGGMHHILHLIPVAAATSLRDDIRVVIYVCDAKEAEECRRVLAALGARQFRIAFLGFPRLLKRHQTKTLTLIWNAWQLVQPACLVVAERTSTVVRSFPLPMPVLLHIPHRAGRPGPRVTRPASPGSITSLSQARKIGGG